MSLLVASSHHGGVSSLPDSSTDNASLGRIPSSIGGEIVASSQESKTTRPRPVQITKSCVMHLAKTCFPKCAISDGAVERISDIANALVKNMLTEAHRLSTPTDRVRPGRTPNALPLSSSVLSSALAKTHAIPLCGCTKKKKRKSSSAAATKKSSAGKLPALSNGPVGTSTSAPPALLLATEPPQKKRKVAKNAATTEDERSSSSSSSSSSSQGILAIEPSPLPVVVIDAVPPPTPAQITLEADSDQDDDEDQDTQAEAQQD